MPSDWSGEKGLLERVATRRGFLAGGLGVLGAFGGYAAMGGRHELEVTHVDVPVRALPDAFVGWRVVQISDIHLEEFTEPWFLQRVVDRVNQLAADIVLLTGDFISRGPGPQRMARRAMPVCAEALGQLLCPLRYAVLGNHDVSVDSEMVIRELAARRIPLLVNNFEAIDKGGDRLWICGVDDPGTSYPDLSKAIPAAPGAPILLMAHEPDYADHVRRHPRFPLVDVMLSGHSHGGQIRLPGVGPLVLPPMGKKYVHGLFRFNHMQLYVNRGIGTVGVPFRFHCPAEISVLTLKRA